MIHWIWWSGKYLKNVDPGGYLKCISIFGFKDAPDELTSLANVRSETTKDSSCSTEVLKPPVHNRDTFRDGSEHSESLNSLLFLIRQFTVLLFVQRDKRHSQRKQ
jgi:hypothetical protein